MRFLRIAVLLVASLPSIAFCADSAAKVVPEKAPKAEKESKFVFSLLPKSLQRNPRLSFNIITEMTAEGRKVAPPSPEHPAYYISQAGGVYNGGIGAEHNIKAPPVEKLEMMMRKSLAEGGYLPSENATQQPTVVVIYHWGSHTFQPPEDIESQDADGNAVTTPSTPEVLIRKTLLDRAMLLGGAKFAREVSDAMQQVDQKATMQQSFVAAPGADFGGSVAEMLPDPFDQLRAKSPEMERLVDELFSSSFFVVASAYDYAALVKKERRLLWRTKMTVNSLGVNMLETVPPLIASAGPYFGHETETPVVINKRVSRDGKVEIGTPMVVPDGATSAKPATPPAGTKGK